MHQVYCETKGLGPPPPGGQNNADYNKQIHPAPWPGVGVYIYTCSMPAQNQGLWNYSLDLDPNDGIDPQPWASFTNLSWQGVAGNRYSWQTEIQHRTTDIVGVLGNKCEFKDCARQVNWNQSWTLANITQADLNSANNALWAMQLGALPSEFRVWDVFPGQ